MVALMLSGLLSTDEALSGFSNPAVLTIAALFIVGGAVMQTGLAGLIAIIKLLPQVLGIDLAKEARALEASAEAAVAESIFRRRAMIIAVAAIALTIVALYLLKRELDRQLDAES